MSDKTIDPSQAGMGDAVVGLWIAEGARRAGETIRFVDCGHGDVIRAFGHETVSERSEDCMRLGSGSNTFNDEMGSAHVDDSPRTLRWQRTMGWDYDPARPILGKLPDEAVGWAKAMHDGRPLVVIAPKANFESRSMPMQKWLRIAWALERDGIRTVAIDHRKEMVDAFPFYAYGFAWSHVLALIASADAVAGNDSSIPHVGATVGVPTIAAMGPTNANVVFGHCFDTLKVVADEATECLGCHFRGEKGYQVACDHGCDALQSISWRNVKCEIEGLVRTPRLRVVQSEEVALEA